jgi:uncharacterized protein (DUF2252 family)
MDKNELVKDLLFMTPDTVVRDVLKRFNARSLAGIEKYSTTLERNDLTSKEWLQHLQDELMDAVLYIEKLKTLSNE